MNQWCFINIGRDLAGNKQIENTTNLPPSEKQVEFQKNVRQIAYQKSLAIFGSFKVPSWIL